MSLCCALDCAREASVVVSRARKTVSGVLVARWWFCGPCGAEIMLSGTLLWPECEWDAQPVEAVGAMGRVPAVYTR